VVRVDWYFHNLKEYDVKMNIVLPMKGFYLLHENDLSLRYDCMNEML